MRSEARPRCDGCGAESEALESREWIAGRELRRRVRESQRPGVSMDGWVTERETSIRYGEFSRVRAALCGECLLARVGARRKELRRTVSLGTLAGAGGLAVAGALIATGWEWVEGIAAVLALLAGVLFVFGAVGLVLSAVTRKRFPELDEDDIREAIRPLAWERANPGRRWTNEYAALGSRYRRLWTPEEFDRLGLPEVRE